MVVGKGGGGEFVSKPPKKKFPVEGGSVKSVGGG